jgi:hypothetical protein
LIKTGNNTTALSIAAKAAGIGHADPLEVDLISRSRLQRLGHSFSDGQRIALIAYNEIFAVDEAVRSDGIAWANGRH